MNYLGVGTKLVGKVAGEVQSELNYSTIFTNLYKSLEYLNCIMMHEDG